jgi:outer membrane protein assembly factor BamC
MTNVTFPSRSTPAARPARLPMRSVSLAVALVVGLSACSSLNEMAGGDKVDYRGNAKSGKGLEVPPDLSQLSTDSRYQPPAQRGAISATDFQANPTTASLGTAGALPAGGTVAPSAVGEVRLERIESQRYLYVPMSVEQLWPQLQAFWQERSLALVVDRPEIGVMETEWSENRAKLPADLLRKYVGKVLDVLYSTNTLDKFRLRVERSPNGVGSEIYLTQRGMEEFFGGPQKDQAVWEPRPRDFQLEGEIYSLLMIKLGAKPEQAQAVVAADAASAAAAPAPRARILEGRPAATVAVDDTFDRAWRRVGLALDRSGFTVEDRDRTQGLYFVRYVDPKSAGREDPGFLSKWFGSSKKQADNALVRYRVFVRPEGQGTEVSVLNASGGPENGEAGQRIVRFIVDELK